MAHASRTPPSSMSSARSNHTPPNRPLRAPRKSRRRALFAIPLLGMLARALLGAGLLARLSGAKDSA